MRLGEMGVLLRMKWGDNKDKTKSTDNTST